MSVAGLLGLAVWMIYVTDRLLDARRSRSAISSARHRFHARHARLFVVGLGIAASVGAILLLQATAALWRFGLGMVGLAGLYGWRVHGNVRKWVPKELACGVLFALGTVGALLLEPFPWQEVLAFGSVCAANCLVIACGERALDAEHDRSAWPQRWPEIERWLGPFLGGLALWGGSEGTGLGAAWALAALLLWVLHRSSWSAEWKRVLADGCLLTPLVLGPWLGS